MITRFWRWRSRDNRSASRPRGSRRRGPQLAVESVESRLLLTAPEIAVFNGAAEIVSGTTTAIDFGTVAQSTLGPTRTFTIENDGDDTLTIGAIQLPTGFSLVEGTAANIAVRGSDTFTVRLDSVTTGGKFGTVSFVTNDDDENPFSFTLQGTVLSSAPEITVLDGAVPLVDGDPIAIDLGSAVIGRPGPTRTFTVRNDGAQTLTISSVSLPSGFVITDGLPPAIAPGGSDQLSIQLATDAAAQRLGEIRIATNDADENPFNFSVTGLVTAFDAPDVAVLSGLTPILDGGTFDFGTAILGQTAPTRTFTIRNDGTTTLTLGTLLVPAGFTLIEGLPSNLSPRATDSFTIQFETTTLGTPTGQVSFATNDPDESPFHFEITGTVATPAPEIRVVREDFVELFDGGTNVSDFVSTGMGQSGGKWAFSVLNDGTSTMTLGPITLPEGFTLFEGLPASLEPGFADAFTVQLATTTAGFKSGDILIANNDGDESPFNIPISGTVLAAAPDITIRSDGVELVDGSTTAFEFGDGVLRDSGPRRTFTVRNDGTTTLTLGSISLPSGYTLLEGLPPTLSPRSSDSFTVRLNTAATGTFAGDITISNDDPDEGPFSFRVSARVLQAPAPEISVFDGATPLVSGAAGTIDLGTAVRRQKGPTRTFTIRNDGSDTLRINRIELPAGFNLVRGARRNLHQRGSDTFVVRLDTRQLGDRAGVIRILSDDSDEPVFSIAITGSVVS
jgi:hypothetical protein